MKGYIRGAQYTTDPANKDEVLAISAEATGQRAEDFELIYNEHIGEIPATGKPKQFGGLPGADKLAAEELYNPDLEQAAAAAMGLK